MHLSSGWGVFVGCYTRDMTRRAHKGVNLGGWLVVEKWMTPSLFKGIEASNEYGLALSKEGRARIRAHHANFINKQDLEWLHAQGITLLRIPIGHWIFGDTPPYVGAIERLDWVINAASQFGMQVLIDLHGAPEAQNAYAHSGSGNRHRDKKWLNNRTAQANTIDILTRLAQRYRTAENVWGIQLLNEPDPGITGLKLARFYRRAYTAITQVARPGTHIIFSDGYAPLLLMNTFGLMAKKDFPVAMDCHFYQCFGLANKRRPFEGHLKKLRVTRRIIGILQLFQPVIVGEWSAMLPYKVGEEKTRHYWRAQEAAYDRSLAVFYWNYKTENPGRWNFRNMIEAYGAIS
jgi:glucan 1,3-beta-glucosidase